MTRSLIIAITTLFLLTPAFAAEPAKSNGHLFYGIKGGFMKPAGSGNDSAGNIGAVMGQSFARYLSWEAELNLTVFDGEVGNRDWDINTLGGYAVFRSEGDINLKAKAGLVYWDDTFDDDIDLSLGIGMGFKMGKSGMLDVEFTQINSDVDYISVGYIFNY
jgi:hypothetical protein